MYNEFYEHLHKDGVTISSVEQFKVILGEELLLSLTTFDINKSFGKKKLALDF